MAKPILDDLVAIKKLDSQDMLASLQLLSNQIRQICQQVKAVKLPISYKKIDKVLILGMGGSALCAHVVKTLFSKELKVPVEIVGDYHLPGYVNNKTLVIASSYSGTTEEVLSSAREAKQKKTKLLVIASGNKLVAWAKAQSVPALIFSTENNPCRQPRMGLGYMIVGHLLLWAKTGILKFSQSQIKAMIKTAALYDTKFGVLTLSKENLAKQLAKLTNRRSVWYIGSEHLVGNTHVAANQMNENGKRFAGYFLIPELNHHLLEGIDNPSSNQRNLLFVLLESKLYDERVQKRYKITEQILQKNNICYDKYLCQEKDKVLQMIEVLVLSSYVGYYAALLKGIDPNLIPYVNYFKQKMKK